MSKTENKIVALLGGCGITGEHTLRRLVKGRKFSKIRLADSNGPRARELAMELGRDLVEPIEFDASDRNALIKVMGGASAVINEIGPYYRYGRACVEAAIEVGVHYFDINDEVDVTIELFEAKNLRQLAERKGLAIVIGLGTSPGMTNMFAKLGATQLTKVQDIAIRLVSNASYRSAAVFAHRLHVFGSNATVYRDGKWISIPAFTEPETIKLPVPPGSGECFIVGHPEPSTIPRFIDGVRNVDVKLGYCPGELNSLLRQVISLGFSSKEPIDVNGTSISPAAMMAAYLGSPAAEKLFEFAKVPPTFGREVRVVGEVAGKPTRIIYRYGGEGSIKYTGMQPALAAELVVEGHLKERGILPPEGLDPRPFLAEALEMGLICEVTKEEISSKLTFN